MTSLGLKRLKAKAYTLMGRVVALTLSITLVVSTLIPTPVYGTFNASANANQRVHGLIDAYAGRYDDIGARGMTVSEFRTLGLYMSNFYVPFATRLNIGEDTNTMDAATTTRDSMLEVLTTIASFDRDFAEVLVDGLVASSLETAASNPLKLGTRQGTAAGASITPLTHGRDATPISYFEFYRLVTGANAADTEAVNRNGYHIQMPNKEALRTMKSAVDAGDFERATEPVTYFVLYYEESGQRQEVFSFIPNLREFENELGVKGRDFITPPSQVVFQQIIANAGFNDTVATSMHDVYYEGIEQESNPLTAILDREGSGPTLTAQQLAGFSQMSWHMYVDGFGNIILDTKANQLVMLPGSMNPYVFNVTNATAGGRTGTNTSIPLNNLQTIASTSLMQGDSGNSFLGNVRNTGDTGVATVDMDLKSLANYRGSNGFGRADNYMLFSSGVKSNNDFSETSWWDFWSTDHGKDYLHYLVGYNAWANFNMQRNTGAPFNFNVQLPHTDAGDFKHSSNVTYERMREIFPKATDLMTGSGRSKMSNETARSIYPYFYLTTNRNDNSLRLPQMKLEQVKGVQAITDVVVADTLGIPVDGIDLGANSALHRESSGVFGLAPIYNADGTLIPLLAGSGIGANSAFGQPAELGVATNIAIDKAAEAIAGNLYLTYIVAADTNKALTDAVGWRLDFSTFPTVRDITGGGNGAITALSDEQLAQLQIWAYLALDPSSPQGAIYTSAAQNNNLSRFLVNLHESMAGQGASTISTGAAAYDSTSELSFMHVTLLDEIPFFQTMFDIYYSFAAYLLAALVIIQVMQVIFKRKSIQMALLSVGLFFVCLVAPSMVIDSSVALLNSQASNIYSGKFAHWAMVQHQGYITQLNALAEGESISNVLNAAGMETTGVDESLDPASIHFQNLLILQSQANPSFAPAPVTIRWQSPKKDNYMFAMEQVLNNNGERAASTTLLMSFLRGNMSNQLFDPSGESLFVYRTILDINNYSRFIYGNTGGDILFPTSAQTQGIHRWNSSADAFRIMGQRHVFDNYMGTGENSLHDRVNNGFIPSLTRLEPNNLKRIHLPLSSHTIATESVRDFSSLTRLDRWGIPQSHYNVTPRNFNDHKEIMTDQVEASGVTSEELVSIAANALLTESPYYYFNWYLYDNGLNITPQKEGDTDISSRKFLLSEDNSFFFNYDIGRAQEGYGELRDFMDMSSLFHMVIPYLRQANEPLLQYSERFDTASFPGISSSESDTSKYAQAGGDAHLRHMHNANLLRLYGPYSAWVDLLYDTRLADPVEIRFAGERQIVEDPLNPESYEIRPMIFSESEQRYWGVTDAELTEVERRILQTNRDTYNDYLQLVNYVNFDPAVVGNAMALMATFNFNRNFSQAGVFEDVRTLYPQSFELRNFSYDAYLRLVLYAASGEPIVGAGADNIYMTILGHTSWWVGIPLVFNTFMATQLLPIARFVALLGITFLAVISMLLYTTGLGIDDSADNQPWWKRILIPLLQFLGINFAMALVFSFFMSEGLTTATGALTPTLSLGSPTTTLLLLAVVFAVVIFVHGYIVKRVYKSLLMTSKELGAVITSTTKGAVTATKTFVQEKTPFMGGGPQGPDAGGNTKGAGVVDASPETIDTPRQAPTAADTANKGTNVNAKVDQGKLNINTQDIELHKPRSKEARTLEKQFKTENKLATFDKDIKNAEIKAKQALVTHGATSKEYKRAYSEYHSLDKKRETLVNKTAKTTPAQQEAHKKQETQAKATDYSKPLNK